MLLAAGASRLLKYLPRSRLTVKLGQRGAEQTLDAFADSFGTPAAEGGHPERGHLNKSRLSRRT